MPVVLVVDDEPDMPKMFEMILRPLNCKIMAANDGATALNMLKQVTPDVLVLDLAMPEIDGYQVLQYVRSQPHLAEMKVIILTARPHMVPLVEPLGIDCWLAKPVMPRDLIDVIGECAHLL